MSAGRAALSVAALGVVLASGCKPNLDETISVVDQPIVLAVQSEPPDVPPPGNATYTALYVDHSGTIAKPAIVWSFCNARNPLANLQPVNTECLEGSGSSFQRIGSGASATSALPEDACKNFGPNVPAPVMGQPPARPVDPDSTGGYYQPVQVIAPSGDVTVAETRLSCGLADAPATVNVEYGLRYHLNTNPALASLSLVSSGSAASPLTTSDKGTNAVSAGEHVTLRAAWAACPLSDACGDHFCGPAETTMSCPADCTMAKGCTGAERFVAFDNDTQALAVQRESIAIAWYTTGGAFDSDRTGRTDTDTATTSDNGWKAPESPGPVHLWVVIRDNRGGVGWTEYVLDVR